MSPLLCLSLIRALLFVSFDFIYFCGILSLNGWHAFGPTDSWSMSDTNTRAIHNTQYTHGVGMCARRRHIGQMSQGKNTSFNGRSAIFVSRPAILRRKFRCLIKKEKLSLKIGERLILLEIQIFILFRVERRKKHDPRLRLLYQNQWQNEFLWKHNIY